jgi:hypothetical protein
MGMASSYLAGHTAQEGSMDTIKAAELEQIVRLAETDRRVGAMS